MRFVSPSIPQSNTATGQSKKTMNWLNVEKLVSATHGRLRGGPTCADAAATPAQPLRIVTHTHDVREGDLFWALSGQNHDGADFAAEAFQRGAVGVVAAAGRVDPPSGRWVVDVEDPLAALHQFASLRRQEFTGDVIAVTGSVGKTTTREMIHAVLSEKLRGCASPHNFNNHVGLPLSLLRIADDHDYAVLELGASAAGEIGQLAALCRPQVGVITSTGDAHLGSFRSRESVMQAKLELLEALHADAWAVLAGDSLLRNKAAAVFQGRTTYVGRCVESDLRPMNVSLRDGLLSFEIDQTLFEVHVWGRHLLSSALVAVAIGRHFGLTDTEIATGLRRFKSLPGRCHVRQIGGIKVIDDSYNASPQAMQAALDVLGQFETPSRRFAVLGDMCELGAAAAHLHRCAGRDVVTRGTADFLLVCGQHSRDYVAGAAAAGMPEGSYAVEADAQSAATAIAQAVRPGDVILVKGSRSSGMERIIEALSKREDAAKMATAATPDVVLPLNTTLSWETPNIT